MLLLLIACGRYHSPSCEETTRVVDDDELLPDLDITVTDLLANAAGERIVPAQVFDIDRNVLEVTAVSVETTRGDGDAEWTDAEEVDEVSYRLGFGDYYPNIFLLCAGGLSVPTVLDVAREDEAGTLVAEGDLHATPDQLAVGQISVSGTVTTTEGDWTSLRSAYAGYDEDRLTGLQLQTRQDIALDWR